MPRVFVSHASKDNYFVGFLVALLEAHHVDTWVDHKIQAGDHFIDSIEKALHSSDYMLLVLSEHSNTSQWLTREIATFAAMRPTGRVIPLVLDRDARPDQTYEGLGLTNQLRVYDDMLGAFSRLMAQLGMSLFPDSERRSETDRRSNEDRRVASAKLRLRAGLSKGYEVEFGVSEFTRVDLAYQVGKIAQYVGSPSSPLREFLFRSKATGVDEALPLSHVERLAFAAWQSLREDDPNGTIYAIYILEKIVDMVSIDFDISNKTRRTTNRRVGEPE